MGYLDNLESNLESLESAEESSGQGERERTRKQSDKEAALAAAPYAEELKKGKFSSDLLAAMTRIGHGLRTKVQIAWMGTTLRFDAREHRMELKPTAKGVVASYFVNGEPAGNENVDLKSNAEKLAKKWLDKVGPRPAEPNPAEVLDM